MTQSDAFNQNTVDWQGAEVQLDTRHLPEYQASSKDIADFQRDGAVLLKAAFNDWVGPLRQGFQRNLDNPQAYAFPCDSNPEGAPGSFFDSYCNWKLIPEYLDFLQHSCCASMAGQFMQSSWAQFFHDHAFVKTPGTQQATPWHQDLPYYCVDGQQTVSVYVSLDHAPQEVAVRFVRGSHRWGQLFYPRVFLDGEEFADSLADPEMQKTPDIDAAPDEYEILAWELEPGDAILFDFRALHGTGDAEVKTIRRAFSTRWLGDDVVYVERVGETSPPYSDHGMKPGDRMREDWFPVLWRR